MRDDCQSLRPPPRTAFPVLPKRIQESLRRPPVGSRAAWPVRQEPFPEAARREAAAEPSARTAHLHAIIVKRSREPSGPPR